MPSFGSFIHAQFILKIHKPTTSFTSKTVIITGASSGLGKETAKHIARLGASKVILGCRNVSKGNKAKLEIESSVRCNPGVVEVWEVDVESPSSIKDFVDKANKLPRLDVLISNAGLAPLKYQVVYGTERTVAVNVIGTFLLALQLIPKLKETARVYKVTPHMTFVGSAMFDVAKYPEKHGDDIFARNQSVMSQWLGDKTHIETRGQNMTDQNQYNLSKLILLYEIIKLASIVDPATNDKSGDPNALVINSLDPCLCKTGLAGELTGGMKVAYKIFEFVFARTAEEGSRLVVDAASAGRQTHGGYLRAGTLQQYPPFITNEDGVGKSEYLWELLSKKLEQLQPDILVNLDE